MPESGSSPRKSRNNGSAAPTRLSGSGRVSREQSISHRQSLGQSRLEGTQSTGVGDRQQGSHVHAGSAGQHRTTLWQRLFGQGQRRMSRRTALQQAQRKNFDRYGTDSSRNLFQRLMRDRNGVKRSHATPEQVNSKLAQDQLRQAVLGRSRQFGRSSSSTSNGTASRRDPSLNGKQNDGHRLLERLAVKGDSRPMLAFQSSPRSGVREQTNALAQRRETRQRSRRGLPGSHNSAESSTAAQAAFLNGRSIAAPRQRENSPTRPRSRSVSVGLYAARMLILSVGIGVLVGTILSMWDPASRSSAGASQQAKKPAVVVSTDTTQETSVLQSGTLTGAASTVQLPKMGQELVSLKAAVQTLALQSPQLTPGIFLFDLDTDAYLDLNGGASFAAASTIKVPILVAFLQDVDAGKIRLDELLTMRKELVAGGSGEMQGLAPGTQFTALETITKMITISDNTATNMVIARLGGMTALNQRFQSWGLVSTALNNVLPDLQGTNTTSPKDMALLMARISQGELVSMRSRDRMLDIMQHTVNRSQLPQGLDRGATIAHKTGDIGGLIGDVGLIDMPNGKRYALTVLVKRSFNDNRAYDLVEKVSRTVYQYLNRVPAAQSRPVNSIPPAAPSEQLPRADNTVPLHPVAPSALTNTALIQP